MLRLLHSVYNPLKGDVKETDFDSITYPYINCKRNEVEYAEGKRLVEAAILQKFNDITIFVLDSHLL